MGEAILIWRGAPGTTLLKCKRPSAAAPPSSTIRREPSKATTYENWYQAEAEILRESAPHLVRRAVIVNVQGVVYTGEYDSTTADGYTPGEWKPGDPVPVRLAGDKLYLRRPNGQELQTTIVKRIG